MRFLNFKLSSPETGGIKAEFTDGLNIISAQDRVLFDLLSEIFPSVITGSIIDSTPVSFKDISCSVRLASGGSEQDILFESSGGYLAIKNIMDGNTSADGDSDSSPVPYFGAKIISPPVIAASYFSPEQVQKGLDPVFDSREIRELLINHELGNSGIPYFRSRGDIQRLTEKELTDLNRERQLLELKKMKRDKLVKDISQSEKQIARLEKKRESLLTYKMSLREINSLLDSKNRLLSRASGLKKDLIELKEIKSKITSVEKTLKEKFSRFADRGNDQLPDLEQIQQAFNSFRDLNEKIDKFYIKKKGCSDWALRGITSLAIFSLTALLFMIFTSSASRALGITSASAGAITALGGIIYYFRFKNLHPADMLEQRKRMEIELIDLLKRNQFAVDGYRTGEIYEVLFQYFEDFINYRDISIELFELKKKMSNSNGIHEKEKKLQELNEEINQIESGISEIAGALDPSIHSRPDINNISGTIHDIDELLAENESEVSQKKAIVSKINDDIEEYDRVENSSLSVELKLEEVMNSIAEKKERMEHIRFIENVFKKSSDSWSSGKLKELSERAADHFLSLTGSYSVKGEISSALDEMLLNSGKLKSDLRGYKKYISISVKAALSDILGAVNLPPLIMIDPFADDNEFADKLKKLLPEMFSGRQILVLVPDIAPAINGNIITI